MLTPWGKADNVVKLQEGVYSVDTPSHGGLMIGRKVARQLLTLPARNMGQLFGNFLAYEEDCLVAVPLFEHREWFEMPDQQWQPEETLKHSLPEYLVARGLGDAEGAFAELVRSGPAYPCDKCGKLTLLWWHGTRCPECFYTEFAIRVVALQSEQGR